MTKHFKIMTDTILIIGASGQIGSELTLKLRKIHGANKVIASDILKGSETIMNSGPFEVLDATNQKQIEDTINKYKVGTVYLMAAMLSATAEKAPKEAWELNMNSLFIILNLAKDKRIQKVFWPSSIAVFGPSTPANNTPQTTVMEPCTVYGISKQTGERWCEYYFNRYGVDVRSIRYPGLISYKTPPGGGTTDYAIEIYHEALASGKYTSFLKAGTYLPMMYMDDAIQATIQLMEAPTENIKIRSSYNLGGVSFDPEEIATSIKKYISDFTIDYAPDFRQDIADSWPNSIDDSKAQEDWDWKHSFDLHKMTETMLKNLREKEITN